MCWQELEYYVRTQEACCLCNLVCTPTTMCCTWIYVQTGTNYSFSEIAVLRVINSQNAWGHIPTTDRLSIARLNNTPHAAQIREITFIFITAFRRHVAERQIHQAQDTDCFGKDRLECKSEQSVQTCSLTVQLRNKKEI